MNTSKWRLFTSHLGSKSLLILQQMPKAPSKKDYLILFTTVALILLQKQVDIIFFFYLFFNLNKMAEERHP